MKCDMDLIRELMLEIEEMPLGAVYETDASSIKRGRDLLAGHLQLLHQAGFVAGFACERDGNALCSGITWQGHQFLNAARSDDVWSQAKTTLRKSGLAVSVDVLTSLLSKIAADMLGLKGDR
ncbi:MAG: DUF2513 domain-containing protein [Planctomycetaceae bacterium]|nr:DUF2513 domain-containing protein [Planctomycetaceae bacterium]